MPVSPSYFVVWSQGPSLGDGTPSGSVHASPEEAQRVAQGRRGALTFTRGPEGPATWRVWIVEVLAERPVEAA